MALPASRRWLHVVGSITLVACMLFIGAIAALHTSAGRRFALARATAILTARGILLETDELRYNLLDLSASLSNIRIASSPAPDAPPFAVIDRARLDLSLLQLLRGRYVVQSGVLDGIEVHVVIDEQGRTNVPRLSSDPESLDQSIDYLIEGLTARNARVRYDDAASRINLDLPIRSLAIKGHPLTGRHTLRVDASGGELRARDRVVPIDRISGDMAIGDDDVEVRRMDVGAGGSLAHVTGSVRRSAARELDLAIGGRIDLALAAEIAALGQPIAGVVLADATIRGPLAAPAISGHLTGSALRFGHIDDVNLTATATYDVGGRRLRISAFDVGGPWGAAQGEAALFMEGESRSRLRASLSSIDVAAFMRVGQSPYAFASRATARIEAEWPGLDYRRVSGEADASLVPTRNTAGRALLPLGGRFDATARDGRIVTRIRSMRVGGVETTGRVAIRSDAGIEGRLRSRVNDVGRVLITAEQFLGRDAGSLLSGSASGSTEIQLSVNGTLMSPSIHGAVAAPALSLSGASGVGLSGDVTFSPSSLAIRRLDIEWLDARAHVRGVAELAAPGRLDLSADVEALDLAAVLAAADLANLPAFGTLSARAVVAGTTAEPEAAVQLHASGLAAYDEPFGSLEGTFSFANREVRVSELRLDKPQPDGNGSVTASASYHVDRKSYMVDLTTDNLRLLGLALQRGRRIQGALDITASGSGTVATPAASISMVADELRIGEALMGRLVADAQVEGQQAAIAVEADRFNMDADMTVGVRHPYPARIDIRVDGLDLSAVPLDPGTRLEGRLTATANAEGDLVHPSDARAIARIETLDAAWNDQPFSVEGPALLEYAGERLTIDRLRLAAQDSLLTFAGTLPLTDDAGEGALEVAADASLATLARYAPADLSMSGEGSVRLLGTLTGTLKAVRPDLTIMIDNGLLLSRRLEPGVSDVTLRTRVAQGEISIEQLSARWGAADIRAFGRVPLAVLPELPVDVPRKNGPAEFEAAITGLNPAAIPGAPRGVGGLISVEAQLSAVEADVRALIGQVTFTDLELDAGGLTLAQREPSAVHLAGGAARVDRFSLSGTLGSLDASGRVGLVGARPINLEVGGNLNLAAVSLVTDAVRAEGTTTLEVSARGTLSSPELEGTITIDDASIVSDEPEIIAERLSARVELSGPRIAVTTLHADVNGGRFEGSGALTWAGGTLRDVDLAFTTEDFAFDAPLELRSLSDSAVRIVDDDDELVVSGEVTIEEAGLTGDIDFDTGLLAAITSRRKLDLTEDRNDLLERVRFDIEVETATPVIVDNNLAQAEVQADLRVLGSPYETGLSGRLTVAEGGVITLNERRYELERGVVTFLDERRIFPSFDLVLNTSAGPYDVTVSINGAPGDTETSLTSTPVLPEPDIMALLVTGRTLDEMRGEEFEVVREQVFSHLAGRIGSSLGRGIEAATGLTDVRLEPSLIANETDPSARLTVGQEIADGLDLVYSTDLADSNDQIWIVEYDVTRRFETRAVRQSDSSYRLDFRHEVELGGRPRPRRSPRDRPTVAVVTISGHDTTDDAELRRRFGVREGDEYDFFAIREGIERVEEYYIERGHLESRARLERDVNEHRAMLCLHVVPGPLVDLVFEGAEPPQDVRDAVRMQWHRGVFDVQRGDDGRDVLRRWLMSGRYLQPRVTYEVREESGDRRQAIFRIEAGPRAERVVLSFDGAAKIPPDDLDDLVESQQLEQQLFTDPVVVTELLEQYYREEGYVAAEVDAPRYEFEGALARVVVPVREGPRFHVRTVSTRGNEVMATSVLLSRLPLAAGNVFLPAAAENGLRSLRDHYWRRGYNDVRLDYELVIDRPAGAVDVEFTVDEGLQSVIADIAIEGNDEASSRLVREQLELSPGQSLDLGALSRSRRNLYDTGAFSVVDITRQELEGDVPAEAEAGADSPVAAQKPVGLIVNVREVPSFRLNYGAAFDSERGLGGVFEIANYNSLGKARVVGLATRYDSQVREARTSLSQPALRYWPIQTTASVYYREERNPATEVSDGFDVSRRGFSILQERELRQSYVWSYGYRYERARTRGSVEESGLDQSVTVSPVTSTLTRDVRDEVLDATRGSFMAHAISYSPSWLGADRHFVKYYGQYFQYFPLQSPGRKPFSPEVLRPRFVYAAGVRVGMALGFAGPLPASERFFAGGSTTLRGFAQNAVGPIGDNGVPLGGGGLLVVNNEVRFPLVSIVDGVLFADVGNVFSRVADFSFRDLRESAGVGVRLRTPWFLLRGDYGVVLDARPGEARKRFYFSLGQAF